MSKKPATATKADETKAPEVPLETTQDQAEKPAFAVDGAEYPRKLSVTNNTPIPLFLTEAGAHLASNFHAPANAAVVTYQTADSLRRELSNVQAVANAHNFTDALTFEEAE